MNQNKIDLRGTLHVTDWLSGIKYAPGEEVPIVQVLFKNTRSAFYRNPDHLPLRKGDWVAVEAQPGHDIGQVMLTGPLVRLQMKKANVGADAEMKRIFRKASEADLEKFHEARAREHETMIRSRQIAAELGLNMKIGDVEYQGDGAKAIFYYIADERVDFRKLIRILADTFKIRIEMKQIGARQEAGRIGGIGPCGRPLCCSSWMSKFVSVGTGAARVQDLSMNPLKLAGQCGKLKCCLNFETDAYAEASRQLPPRDAVLITQDAEYYQFKTDILARTVTYSTDKHLAANLVTIPASRAFEIIRINKQGGKVEQLEAEKPKVEPAKEYVELVGQDSLTRFDKSGRAKKKRRNKGGAEPQPKPEQSAKKSGDSKAASRQQPEQRQPKEKQRQNADRQEQRRPEGPRPKQGPRPQPKPKDKNPKEKQPKERPANAEQPQEVNQRPQRDRQQRHPNPGQRKKQAPKPDNKQNEA
ncbi:MAG: hypothetical protein K2I37_08700 [Muribaculaceae bacterium]|nr:hypothetical protein [Muribaculaceae bacterium]